jgi:hypothetical protein
MSAANFIKLFRDMRKSIDGKSDFDAYKRWVDTNKTWFNKNRDELVADGLSKYVDLLITEDRAESLGVGKRFKQLITELQSGNNKEGPIVQEVNGKPAVMFPNIPFKGGIERALNKYLGDFTYERSREQGYVKGHVYGLMTGAVTGARDELFNFLTGSSVILKEDEADLALDFLDVLIDHLTKLDIESSDIKNIDARIFLKYRKSAEKFLIELQAETDNAASAKLVQALAGRKGGSTGIRALINPGANQTKALEDIISLLKKNGTFTSREIADFQSSPSMKKLVIDSVVDTIKGKSKSGRVYTEVISMPDPVAVVYVDSQSKAAYQKRLKVLKQEAKANKTKILANKARTGNTSAIKSTASLDAILRNRLALQIKKNMGTGNAKNILNYRTGRFAESATIERTVTSRAGMVSVFYDYMRYPYATFSAGGAQEYPKTRDPKLLISKSIREIGATIVGNRMRAILV